MVAITVFAAASMTDIVPSKTLETYTRLPSGLTQMPVGPLPTGIVAITVLVVASITDTSSEIQLATYTRVPFGLTLTGCGVSPTGMVATRVFVARSITVTSSEPKLVIYANPLSPPSGVTVIVAVSGMVTLADRMWISPVPLAGRPIAGLSFVQEKVGLPVPENSTWIESPTQTA